MPGAATATAHSVSVREDGPTPARAEFLRLFSDAFHFSAELARAPRAAPNRALMVRCRHAERMLWERLRPAGRTMSRSDILAMVHNAVFSPAHKGVWDFHVIGALQTGSVCDKSVAAYIQRFGAAPATGSEFATGQPAAPAQPTADQASVRPESPAIDSDLDSDDSPEPALDLATQSAPGQIRVPTAFISAAGMAPLPDGVHRVAVPPRGFSSLGHAVPARDPAPATAPSDPTGPYQPGESTASYWARPSAAPQTATQCGSSQVSAPAGAAAASSQADPYGPYRPGEGVAQYWSGRAASAQPAKQPEQPCGSGLFSAPASSLRSQHRRGRR